MVGGAEPGHRLHESRLLLPAEPRGAFGTEVADVVVELTDVTFLAKELRKRLQVAKAGRVSDRARQVKLADKICNLRDILASPPAGWSLARRQKYTDWAKDVVDQARGVNPRLERMFDQLYRQRPGEGGPAWARNRELLTFSADETADLGVDFGTPVVEAVGAGERSRLTMHLPEVTIEVRTPRIGASR